MYGLAENKTYDVVGIGNAILDIIAMTDDAFIEAQGLKKSTMMLIDEARAKDLYDQMGQTTEVSGGSAANTLAGMASLGSKVAFIGKVHEDQMGEIYRHDLKSVGVTFDTPSTKEGMRTGCSYILVTPDAERTMNTYLGAGSEIYEADIDPELVGDAKIVYGEGYQWSTPHNKDALRKAFKEAKERGVKVAFTLSDVFCVEAHREDFRELLDDTFDILFANEEEIKALYPDMSFGALLEHVQGKADIIVITRSEHGSIILTPQDRVDVEAESIDKLVDTTGAGDLYAAGFLHGYCQNKMLAECGKIGSRCAAEIIQHLGARARRPLKDVA
ncbi:MAG: adenosine kinase [Rickettsiales bacterium]|nr:adenosine kinase [Rickettsiales bacterium]